MIEKARSLENKRELMAPRGRPTRGSARGRKAYFRRNSFLGLGFISLAG